MSASAAVAALRYVLMMLSSKGNIIRIKVKEGYVGWHNPFFIISALEKIIIFGGGVFRGNFLVLIFGMVLNKRGKKSNYLFNFVRWR